mmetsp:Transcript_22846/g.51523  ORF Transcript_22846/g.51523 Transcript_22846/m.51523 type:complete len:185 (-) Transcript_22846:265-819(-)|eukprot:CAMPEP_0172596136 /NCGR_PEP_ID=MMETSP1068-20121228/15870_1 /TAXON_ID=35684 /ORGANISM="Pseudopedinella elastica, Strain CCMP716" /LENGTH=184 /DNA_ID=CAMNT_0013395029 /DNA_START=278 /DNA_END=832 /DNA_ORIENTATION=-
MGMSFEDVMVLLNFVFLLSFLALGMVGRAAGWSDPSAPTNLGSPSEVDEEDDRSGWGPSARVGHVASSPSAKLLGITTVSEGSSAKGSAKERRPGGGAPSGERSDSSQSLSLAENSHLRPPGKSPTHKGGVTGGAPRRSAERFANETEGRDAEGLKSSPGRTSRGRSRSSEAEAKRLGLGTKIP